MTLPDTAEHLLPPSATPAERTLGALSGRITAVPTPIAEMHRPNVAPERFLPWLAWEWSIDLWQDEWSDAKKRRVLARSFDLHRLKGTAQGLREHVALTDASVVQIVRPPQGAFAGRDLTKDEMDDWLRTMPQIRIYMAREVGHAGGGAFADQDFVGEAAAVADEGRALIGRAARLWDRGVETRLVLYELTTTREARLGLRIERVMIPGRSGADTAFADATFGDDGYADASQAEPQFVTFRQDVAYQHITSGLSMRSARPGFDPVDVRSERISAVGIGEDCWFCDDAFGDHAFAGADDAEWMLYDRIVLHDPVRAAPVIESWSFYDDARLGLPNYTAMVTVDLQTTAEPRSSYSDHAFTDEDFTPEEDARPRERVRDAVLAAKALRDRILVTHKMRRPLTLVDGIPIDGSYALGGTIEFRL